LAQIEEAAEKVESLCAGKTFEAFSEDWVAVRLAHGYDEIEGVILWNAATVSILEMRRTIRVMLSETNP
jgi:uncharacterized protein with HEPN domain